jgi:hypothetical protein
MFDLWPLCFRPRGLRVDIDARPYVFSSLRTGQQFTDINTAWTNLMA